MKEREGEREREGGRQNERSGGEGKREAKWNNREGNVTQLLKNKIKKFFSLFLIILRTLRFLEILMQYNIKRWKIKR